jgi:hypothetical protein
MINHKIINSRLLKPVPKHELLLKFLQSFEFEFYLIRYFLIDEYEHRYKFCIHL